MEKTVSALADVSFEEKTMAVISPYIATTSQKMILIKFFVVMRGARTPAPMMDAPVIKIPHAAPTTENPMQHAMPRFAHMYGDVVSRNWPTLNVSPWPVKSMSETLV